MEIFRASRDPRRDTARTMSQENLEVVRRIYEGWATGDFGVGRDDLSPNVLFAVAPDFPESGVVVGPEGIQRYMLGFLEQWEHYSLKAVDLRAVGDTVLARVTQRGKGRTSGAESESEYYMLFTFRGGRILAIEAVREEASALEAVGVSE